MHLEHLLQVKMIAVRRALQFHAGILHDNQPTLENSHLLLGQSDGHELIDCINESTQPLPVGKLPLDMRNSVVIIKSIADPLELVLTPSATKICPLSLTSMIAIKILVWEQPRLVNQFQRVSLPINDSTHCSLLYPFTSSRRSLFYASATKITCTVLLMSSSVNWQNNLYLLIWKD